MTVAALARTPEAHFRLHFFGAVLALRERLPEELRDAGFVGAYAAEAGAASSAEWDAAAAAWEAAGPPLPLTELARAAGLDAVAIRLLFTAALVDEDARFGILWEALEGAGRARPTAGLLETWELDGTAKPALRALLRLGLLEPEEGDGPRGALTLRPPPLLLDVLRGEQPDPGSWLRLEPAEEQVPLSEVVLEHAAEAAAARVASAAAGGLVRTIVVRGHERSGRRTLAGALARDLGLGVLHVEPAAVADARWRLVGPFATLLRALPVVTLDLAPGETADVDLPPAYDGRLAIVVGRQGGLAGSAAECAVTLELEMPGEEARRRHWRAETGVAGEHVAGIAARARMTPGNVRRVARLAQAEAAVADRACIDASDLRAAARALHGRLLDTLAERVETSGDWSRIAVAAETARELALLEARCRHREHLGEAVGASFAGSLTPGVRALFTGPSGTGKTLAAAILAAELEVDLYRLDLSSVVNKYLGETEKNLARVFARAEEADVALLLDEGDALLTQRTAVHTANDRYANLETNYLLQRLESFEGILIVTTNAGDRIDTAFRRRMDVVVDFRLPDAGERWAIWNLHLPELHAVDPATLDEVVARCELSGGQIRNAVLHASLLALDAGEALRGAHVRAAVEREYRKSGEVCPIATREHAYG